MPLFQGLSCNVIEIWADSRQAQAPRAIQHPKFPEQKGNRSLHLIRGAFEACLRPFTTLLIEWNKQVTCAASCGEAVGSALVCEAIAL